MGVEDEVRRQSERTRQTWEELLRQGLREGDPVAVDAFFLAPREEAALRLTDGLTGLADDVEVGSHREGVLRRRTTWSVTCTAVLARASLPALDRWVSELVRVGDRHGVELDGWGAEVRVAGPDEGSVAEWQAVIDEHGWMVVDVRDREDEPAPGPPFQFTAGLTPRGLPELVVYGLPGHVGMELLNDLAQRLVDGQRFADGEPVPDLVKGDHRVQLRTATRLLDPLGAAECLYGDAVRVRQLVLPDEQDRLPWEPGYADEGLQPLLFDPPAGSPG